MEINLKNIEEIFFYDKKLQELFPEFRHFFDQWMVGKRVPALTSMAKKSILDLLESIDLKHVEKLEKYFNTKIAIVKLNTKLVKNHQINLDENICGFTEYKDFCVYRKKDQVFLSFWR